MGEVLSINDSLLGSVHGYEISFLEKKYEFKSIVEKRPSWIDILSKLEEVCFLSFIGI